MSYRVVVASTKQDLSRERAHIVAALERADLMVVHMESWAADPEAPPKFSAANMAGCHFCVALVAFQRGSIDPDDPQGRSITQIELDEASRLGVDVLPYLLEDTAENRGTWPAEHNHLDDPRVSDWRRALQLKHTSEFFQAGQMPEVLPAIAKRIVKREQRRRRRLIILTAALLLTFVMAMIVPIIWLNVSPPAREWALSRYLSWKDPVLFYGARNEEYRVARLIPGDAAVQEDSTFGHDIVQTKSEFCMFANTFGFYRNHDRAFEELAQRGVKLRFVVSEFHEADWVHWETFAHLTGETDLQETIAQAKNLRALIERLRTKHPPQVELRLNRKPLFYTMWLCDPQQPTALAHLGVHYYAPKSHWPSFRISERTGKEMLPLMVEEFTTIWNDATRVPSSSMSE